MPDASTTGERVLVAGAITGPESLTQSAMVTAIGRPARRYAQWVVDHADAFRVGSMGTP